MASSSADAHSQPGRPAPMARQSSTSSQVSRSPSDTHHKAAPKAPRQHVVGQSRLQRNTSLGKNLNKLNKLTQPHAGDGSASKHHRRSLSGNSTSAPSSPRPGFKRNASSGGIVRAANNTHGHTTIRKNHSSGHLARQGAAKTALKSSKSEIAPPKRSLANPGKARQLSPDDHPTVHFDVGDDEGGPDDGWTEESASQSPTTNNARELSQSAGSTLVDTPGRDLVSRFMDGEGSAGTPNNSSFLPSRNSPQAAGGEMDKIKRNKSMPNVAGTDSPSRAHSRRSGTTTPTDLPPSRTQQKLMLQRASSNIEPQKLIPVILPRTGGPTFLHSGMTYTTNGEGRLDPRLQQQFNHVAVEYNVVRRYRNPLADAIVRIEQIPGTPRKTRVPKSNGFVNVHGSSSLSTSFHDETDGRRSRVSFENARGSRDDGDLEGRQSFESDNGRIRNEAEEICRRLWESSEAVEGD